MVSNVQLGGVQLYVVLIMSRRGRGLVKLEHGIVVISLSDVVAEERRQVGCADDGGTGSFVGHERCDGRSLRRNGRRRDLFKMLPRVLEETGTQSSCAGIARDREHPNVAKCSGTATCDSRRVRG